MIHPTAITAAITYNCRDRVTVSRINAPYPVVRVWAKVVAGHSAPSPQPFPPEPYRDEQEIGWGPVNGGQAVIDKPGGANWPDVGDYTVIYWLDYGESSDQYKSRCDEMGGGGGGGAAK